MLGLTKKTGYGLIAMTHLARLPAGQLASAREIAERFGTSRSLLMNVLKELAAAGYVDSVRGARGGYRIVPGWEKMTLADLVTTLEGRIRLAECIAPDGPGRESICRLIDNCPIANPVHRVQRKLEDFLKQVTLAEIVSSAGAVAAARE